MKPFVWAGLSAADKRAALARPDQRREARVVDVVRQIFDEVEAEGEAAVSRWSQKLDGQPLRRLSLDTATVDRARAQLELKDLEALAFAAERVRLFHQATKPQEIEVETAPGVRCRRVWRPVQTCGLYVPGGTAPLFSTLLMLAIPAGVAGVPERVTMTPSRGDLPHPMMIAAAAASGLDSLWLTGGAQAIAAMTFGAGVPRTDKIFGPGNAFVAEAKRYAADLPGGPAIDLPAGPSELMVIADDTASPAIVAADLLSQAEHDADAQVVLVALSQAVVDAVVAEIERQVATLPRVEIARRSLGEARVFLVRDLTEAAEASNAYAPEHLSLQLADPSLILPQLNAAGTIFVGRYAAETFGDYVSGPSHVLPTDGAARTWSGVATTSFMTSFVVHQVDAAGGRAMSGPAARLARLEGLEAHARAADLRGTQA
jgi:histidinol dehydrogenase